MENRRNLTGKTALITGASRGIGRAIAEEFARAGANLVIVARDDKAICEFGDSLRAAGRTVFAQAVDLARTDEIDALFVEMDKRKIELDILVNNAAIMIKGLIESYTRENLEQMLAVDVQAPFILSQKAIPMMKNRGGGAIVNMSSLSGCVGVEKFPGFAAYDMSKYALWGLTEMLAIENMQYNIRVNQLSLSAVDTDMYRAVAPPELKPNLSAADVARHVLYLAGPDSEPLTGENIILTGMAPAR